MEHLKFLILEVEVLKLYETQVFLHLAELALWACGFVQPIELSFRRAQIWFKNLLLTLNLCVSDVCQDKERVVSKGYRHPVSTILIYFICIWLSLCTIKIEFYNVWELGKIQSNDRVNVLCLRLSRTLTALRG